MLKKILAFALSAVMAFSISVSAFAKMPGAEIVSEAWCVADAKTGQVIIGGLNWGLIGLLDFDLVAWLFGGPEMFLSRAVYALVGIGAIWSATLLFRPREERA